MPKKRGRPISTDTTNAAVLRRRQLTAERTRRYRQQPGPATAAAAPQQQTAQQSRQAEAVAEHPFDDREAALTLLGLGLRVQSVALAQDTGDAQLQRDAVQVDEHEALYSEDELPASPPRMSSTPPRPSPEEQQLPTLARFFETLPPRNPFAGAPSDPVAEGDDGTADILATDARDQEESGKTDEGTGGENSGGEGSDPVLGLIDKETRSQHIAEEETSTYDFTSKHSDHTSDTESDIIETSAHEHAVQKLYEQLQGGFHGCSQERHQEQLQEHLDQAGDNHHSLDDIHNDPSFPSVLGLTELISTERLERQPFPTPSQWRAVFCGTPQQQCRANRYPMNVCLHKEETQAVEPQVAFDIDSFLGFGSSLSIARQGL